MPTLERSLEPAKAMKKPKKLQEILIELKNYVPTVI